MAGVPPPTRALPYSWCAPTTPPSPHPHPTPPQDGWEDDEEDENFTKQLRAELQLTEASAKAAEPAAMQQ